MSLVLELLYIPVWIMRMAAGRAVLISDHKYAESQSFCTDLERGTITAWHFWIYCQIIQSVGIWSQLYEIFRFHGLYQFTGTKRFLQCFYYQWVPIHFQISVFWYSSSSSAWLIYYFCLIWLSWVSVSAWMSLIWSIPLHIHFNVTVKFSYPEYTVAYENEYFRYLIFTKI